VRFGEVELIALFADSEIDWLQPEEVLPVLDDCRVETEPSEL
jgi:hypothetical protein